MAWFFAHYNQISHLECKILYTLVYGPSSTGDLLWIQRLYVSTAAEQWLLKTPRPPSLPGWPMRWRRCAPLPPTGGAQAGEWCSSQNGGCVCHYPSGLASAVTSVHCASVRWWSARWKMTSAQGWFVEWRLKLTTWATPLTDGLSLLGALLPLLSPHP